MLPPDLTFDAAPHTYRHQGIIVPSVTQILDITGFTRAWSAITQEDREMYFARGHWTHRVAELLPNGDLDRSTDWFVEHADVWAGYVGAIDGFYAAGDYEPVATEVRLYHPILRYAGSPDGLGLWHGKPCVLDFKNGVTASLRPIQCYIEAQTAAYRLALPWLVNYPYKDRPHLRVAIELHGDGTWKPVQLIHREPEKLFLTALSLFNQFAMFDAV